MQYRILWYHNSNQPRLGAIYLRVIIICLLFLFRNFRFSPNYISWYLFRILTDYNYLLYICLFYNLFHFRLFSLKLTLEWFFLGFLCFLLPYLFTHFALSILIDDSLSLFSFPIYFCFFTISISCLHFIF